MTSCQLNHTMNQAKPHPHKTGRTRTSSLLLSHLLIAAVLPQAAIAQQQTQTPPPAAESRRPLKSEGASNPEAAANAEAIRRRAAAAQAASAPEKSASVDQKAMREAWSVTQLLIQAGEIGMRRAVDPAVQGLAQSMAVRHRELAGELEAMAKTQHVPLASDASHRARLARLPDGGGFDTAFVRDIGIEVPTQAIAKLGAEPSSAGDPAWTAWRGRLVDTLREQLSMAQRIPLRNAADKTPRSSSGDPTATPSTPTPPSRP